MTFFMVLFLMLAAHALADYPLQGDFLAINKLRSGPNAIPWYYALVSHAMIHGGFVALITGFWWIGFMEVIAHTVIDYLKCEGRISFDMDQMLHVWCKFTWALCFLIMTTV